MVGSKRKGSHRLNVDSELLRIGGPSTASKTITDTNYSIKEYEEDKSESYEDESSNLIFKVQKN